MTHRYTCRRLIMYFDVPESVWMAQAGWDQVWVGSVPKPRKSFVVASVCFSLGLGVCLFYALHYQQGEGTAVVLRARFVRTRYEYADVPAEVRIIFEY